MSGFTFLSTFSFEWIYFTIHHFPICKRHRLILGMYTLQFKLNLPPGNCRKGQTRTVCQPRRVRPKIIPRRGDRRSATGRRVVLARRTQHPIVRERLTVDGAQWVQFETKRSGSPKFSLPVHYQRHGASRRVIFTGSVTDLRVFTGEYVANPSRSGEVRGDPVARRDRRERRDHQFVERSRNCRCEFSRINSFLLHTFKMRKFKSKWDWNEVITSLKCAMR